MPAMTEPMAGDESVVLADRYVLEDVIGRGGMAVVHRATDRVLHRPVAVKVLRDTADDATDRTRFTAEARTLAQLNHPGLVMILDAGTTAAQPYLVLELVEGATLAEACSGRAMATSEVAPIGRQLAAALAYAHEQGVVHRDVKPGNVLIDREGRVKLADFGIARLIGDTVRHTQTGQAIGTAAYLAPEQVLGEEITPAADVYALGLVLLEALTGQRAFPGPATEAALARLSRDPEIPDTLSTDWRHLISAMTASDPTGRPSAAEVSTLLHSDQLDDADSDQQHAGADGAEDAGATRLLTTGVPTSGPGAVPVAGPTTSLIDRWGDTLARQPSELAARAAELPPHLRAVVASIAALVLLVVIAAFASGGGNTSDDLPDRTPQKFREPLGNLHDTINQGS